MAKKRPQPKAKEPVRLRFRELAHGNKSMYFDIYDRGKRWTETLPFVLVPEVDENSRNQNRNALQSAMAMKSQRVLDMMYHRAGLSKADNRSKMLLVDWMNAYAERKADAFKMSLLSTIKHLIQYRGDAVTMKDVDKNYLLGFISHLRQTNLSPRSQDYYFKCLACALSTAVREEIISTNPMRLISKDMRIKVPSSTREYLTIDEVKVLMNAPCKHEDIKRAYLFSCFCGLRMSDVRGLKWGDLQKDGENIKIAKTMQKTQKMLYLKLSSQAIKWLPKQDNPDPDSPIFRLPSRTYVSKIVAEWAKDNGINKHITFHTSRHTFATGELTAGADIYTVSSLLGHTQIRTTQIYAKIVNKKKEEAVDMWSKLFD